MKESNDNITIQNSAPKQSPTPITLKKMVNMNQFRVCKGLIDDRRVGGTH
jgi:hypothetical protein